MFDFSRRSGTPFVNTKTDCHCQGRRHARRNAVQAAIPRDGFINAVECASTCSDKLCSSQVYGKRCKYWHAVQRVCDDVGNAATGTRILNGSAASPSATSPRRPVRGSRSTYVHGPNPLASQTKPKSLRIRCNGTARRSTVPLPFLAPAARRQLISFSTAASPSESPGSRSRRQTPAQVQIARILSLLQRNWAGNRRYVAFYSKTTLWALRKGVFGTLDRSRTWTSFLRKLYASCLRKDVLGHGNSQKSRLWKCHGPA